ncbi:MULTISPECIES: MmpS family transport accessory protein [unclassified Rhodococcus (in: high G+C Gram-positive bacteria)]|uniref:MmpS family transport accessory protein n=1 Tax=unclassified Rhodococcus (in: high G+C Gram-positive bacteria) TaxID=192944 RepID=UPI00163A9E57|nr:MULTISPECIES: MmpS family transport accessory protein [unclassified Rhodococcus (in: high G+C Gram-positive bacteria)]MBC2644739.1 hypothetical protein [Rhodococcus sp. 3A]MBC2898334.1 hypothetical protein [Rhodococcus sp. 4CII]
MTQPPPPGPPQQPYGQQPYPQQPGQPYPNQYGYPPAQPPKKRTKWPWILLAIVVVFIAGVAGCTALVGGAINSVDEESKKEVAVTYEVTGEGQGAIVTYTSADMNMAQESGIALPWTKEVTVTGIIKTASLTASNGFEDSGTITCRILVDGAVVTENTSSGVGATASCIQGDLGGN